MAASKLKASGKSGLSAYSFDTSNYIVMDMKVRRDAKTGRLVEKKSIKNDQAKK